MEVEEIQTQGGSKFPRITNCNFGDRNEENRRTGLGIINGGGGSSSALGRFCGWPSASSRIVRISRASGGKDRHSKVWTSKGLRDRRVRLSVHTAIQFYDLQDRLGYDQPSKAVEWLLKAAARSIDDLPSINTSYFPDLNPDPPLGGSGSLSGEVEIDTDELTESTQPVVSSNSETSKGSGGALSLSRSENRVKARERAKERRAEKEKERENVVPSHHQLLLCSQSSFTELLTGEGGGGGARQWGSASPLDYFSMAHYHSSQIQNHDQLQQFSLLNSEHMNNNAAAAAATDLGFTMSSSDSGNMNRGTLQSNSQQQHSMLLPHHHHQYGSGVPFFVGTAAHTAENHHHHHNLHLHHQQHQQQFYGDENGRHLDHKGKGKN